VVVEAEASHEGTCSVNAGQQPSEVGDLYPDFVEKGTMDKYAGILTQQDDSLWKLTKSLIPFLSSSSYF
jgi:hypothetical protein